MVEVTSCYDIGLMGLVGVICPVYCEAPENWYMLYQN